MRVPFSTASLGDDDEEQGVVKSARSSLEENRRTEGVVGVGVDNSCKGDKD